MGRIEKFTAQAILWFLFWLTVWYVSSHLLMAPVYFLVKSAVAVLFPSWAGPVHWIGHDFILSTTLSSGIIGQHATTLAVKANFLTFGVGWPLIVALLLASDSENIIRKVLAATIILWLPQSAGILIEFAHAIYIQSGLLGVSPTWHAIIIISFEFMIMIMPALAGIIIWLWFEESFVRSLVLQAQSAASNKNSTPPAP